MDSFPATHFDLESPEYRAEDFQGEARGDEIIYISSDETMECMSSTSVDDLDNLSDDDEVTLLAQCVERQMELSTTTESIPLPSCVDKQAAYQARTPGFLTSEAQCLTQGTLTWEWKEVQQLGTRAWELTTWLTFAGNWPQWWTRQCRALQ